MEILFTSVFAQFEATLVLIFLTIIFAIFASYAYEYIDRIIRIF